MHNPGTFTRVLCDRQWFSMIFYEKGSHSKCQLGMFHFPFVLVQIELHILVGHSKGYVPVICTRLFQFSWEEKPSEMMLVGPLIFPCAVKCPLCQLKLNMGNFQVLLRNMKVVVKLFNLVIWFEKEYSKPLVEQCISKSALGKMSKMCAKII